jgi:hypothetical protein
VLALVFKVFQPKAQFCHTHYALLEVAS